MTKPKTIFKYMSITTNTLKNIKAQSLFMSSPVNFNDPYDCSINIIVNTISDSDIKKIIQYYLQRDDISPEIKGQFKKLEKEKLRELLSKVSQKLINESKSRFLHSNGVTCFSEINDDLLMWAHYCDSYKGICLEFRTQYEPFNKLRKVNYLPNFPKTNVLQLLIDENYSHIEDLYCTKSECWRYENEWRLIHNKAGTSYVYPPDALKAIYFGPKLEQEFLEIICLIIQGQNSQVEFWKSKLNELEFKIEFKQFDYTPYIKAKEQGII